MKIIHILTDKLIPISFFFGVLLNTQCLSLNLSERKQLLEKLTKQYQLNADVNLEKIACFTLGINDQYHQKLIHLAVAFAKQRSSKTISRQDFDNACNIIVLGPEKMDMRNAKEIWENAVHEAGHAMVCMLLNPELLYKVTIVPYTLAMGSTFYLFHPEKNYDMQTYCSHLIVAYAGAAAEEIILKSADAQFILTNAQSVPYRLLGDFYSARDIVSHLLNNFSLSLYKQEFSANQKLLKKFSYYDLILQRHYDKAKELIKNNRDKLIKLANALVEHKTLTESQVKEIFESSKETDNSKNISSD